jgi:hypothetical protein
MTIKAHLQALAEHYPSLLVSGVAHGAIKEIERLDRDLTIERNLTEARQLLTANLEADLERVRKAAYAMNDEHRAHAKQLVARADADFEAMLDAKAALAVAVEALEKLSCLGNGDCYGNSIGNTMAQDALAKIKEKK